MWIRCCLLSAFWPSWDRVEVQYIPGGLLKPSGGGDEVFLTSGLETLKSDSRGSGGLWSSFKGLLEGLATCWREKWRGLLLLFGLTLLDEGLVEWREGSGMKLFMYDQNLLSTPCNLKLSKTSQGDPGALIVNVNVILLFFINSLNQSKDVLSCSLRATFLQSLFPTCLNTPVWKFLVILMTYCRLDLKSLYSRQKTVCEKSTNSQYS